jgi:hypothetical protein
VPNDRPQSAPWRAAARDALPVMVVVGLLVLAAPGAKAVGTAWHLGLAGRGYGAARVGAWILSALLAGAAAVMTAAVAVALLRRLRRRGRPDDESEPEWQPPLAFSRWGRTVAVVTALAAAAVPFLAVALFRHAMPASSPVSSPASSPVSSAASAAPPPASAPRTDTSHITGTTTVTALGLAALVILALVGLLAARRHPVAVPASGDQQHRVPGVAGALAEASRDGVAALAGNDDPRAAVLRCYAAMAAALGRTGVTTHPSDVPGELLRRAVAAGIITTPPVAELTTLFGEARFSSHPFTEAQRQAAVAALARIRRELSGDPVGQR